MEWLGDVGGLFDALALFVGVLMTPISNLFMKKKLLNQLLEDEKPPNCWCNRKMFRLMSKASERGEIELDLIDFLQRHRQLLLTSLVVLNRS